MGTEFEKPQGELGNRVTRFHDSDYGSGLVKTVVGSRHTDATGSVPIEAAIFEFNDPELGGVVYQDEAGDTAWTDTHHDDPDTHIAPRISRAAEMAVKQAQAAERYKAFLESPLAQAGLSAMARLSRP
jgi:hypothetical protein